MGLVFDSRQKSWTSVEVIVGSLALSKGHSCGFLGLITLDKHLSLEHNCSALLVTKIQSICYLFRNLTGVMWSNYLVSIDRTKVDSRLEMEH